MDAKSGAACSFEEQTGLSEWALRRISLVFGIWIVVMQGALGGLGFVHHVRRHWVVETSTRQGNGQWRRAALTVPESGPGESEAAKHREK